MGSFEIKKNICASSVGSPYSNERKGKEWSVHRSTMEVNWKSKLKCNSWNVVKLDRENSSSSRASTPPWTCTYVSGTLDSDNGVSGSLEVTLGNSPSCTPWTRDSSGSWQVCESPRLSHSRVSQTQPTGHETRHTHRTTQCSRHRGWPHSVISPSGSRFLCIFDKGLERKKISVPFSVPGFDNTE